MNGVAEKACEDGIAVIAFDSLLTAPCAYKLSFDFTQYKTTQAEATIDLIGGKGKVIVVRGVKGSGPDNLMYEAQMAALKNHPEVEVVATVYGQATASRSEEHTSELQSLMRISYAVFCLKKKKKDQ